MPRDPYAPYVIDDSNVNEVLGDGTVVEHGGVARYLMAMPRPMDYRSIAVPYTNQFPELTDAQLVDIARKRKAARARMVDKVQALPSYDQASTNYCWVNSAAQGGTMILWAQGNKRVIISAASIGTPITGGRNNGGFPEDALKQLTEVGAASEDLWPRNKISMSLWNDAKVQADLKHHRITCSLVDLAGNKRLQLSAVAAGLIVPTGYNWWRHSTIKMDIDEDPDYPGRPIALERNSWGDEYGFKIGPYGGYYYLRGGREVADDAYAICAMLASDEG